MRIYINDFYPEYYLVYPDGQHYIFTNYAAGYAVHMYNWRQFFTKEWCQKHIYDVTEATVKNLEDYILHGFSHKKHLL